MIRNVDVSQRKQVHLDNLHEGENAFAAQGEKGTSPNKPLPTSREEKTFPHHGACRLFYRAEGTPHT